MSGWDLHGRAAEVGKARAALLDGRSVLVIGVAGVGKTRLAAEAASSLPAEEVLVAAVVGTAAGATVPFAAIAPLLSAEAVDGGLPLLVGLRRTLGQRAAGRRVVVQVDDAQHLDPASALLVHQLVDLGEATLLVTQRSGTRLPEPISRTLHDEPFARVELEPLDPAATVALGAAILGAPLDAASAQRLWDLTEGNPLFVREVLLAAGDAAPLDLGPAAVGSARLLDLVDRRLAGLAPEASDGLLHLALGEPLGPGELDRLLAAGVLAELEEAQLVRSHLDDRRLVVRLSHPLYGEVLRAAASPMTLRAVHRRLAEALRATGARRRGDVARLATWALDGALEIDPATLVAAAGAAHLANDHVGTVRLGRAALERSGDFAVGEAVFDALYAIGDPDAIDAHLDAWGALAVEPDQRVAVALARGISTYWRRGDLARATEVLEGAAAEEGSGRRLEAVGQLASFVAFSGRPVQALAMVEPLLVDPEPDRVLIHAALAANAALRSLARPVAALAVAEQALDVYRALGPQILLIPELVLTSARSCALADAARFGEAVELARRGQERARATGDQGSLALAAMAEAFALLPQGLPASMVEVLAVPEQVFAASEHAIMGSWVHGLAALGRATSGDLGGARAHLAALDAQPVGPAVVFRSVEARARAWTAWLDGRPDDGHALLRAEADGCRAGGDLLGEAWCRYDLARLDRPEEVADRLDELAAVADGDLWPTLAAQVRARVDGDPVALGRVADVLAGMGAWLWAAEAAFSTADAHRRAGAQREATAWANRAEEWRGRCETVRSPGLVATSGPDPLSRREREVAILAAQGLPSRVIGERLFVGTRTVESHLARVYTKLGIRSRAELARLLDGDQAEPHPVA